MPTKQEIKLDERLRRQILETLYATFTTAATQSLAGDVAMNLANDDGGYEFADDDHFLRLARSLLAMGLVEEKAGEMRRRGEAYSLRHSRWQITPKGVELMEERIDPVRGVWDERIGGDE